MTTSSPLSRFTTTCGLAAMLRNFTDRRSPKTYSTSSTDAVQIGTACGAPAGSTVPIHALRAASKRAMTSHHVTSSTMRVIIAAAGTSGLLEELRVFGRDQPLDRSGQRRVVQQFRIGVD